MYFLKKKYWLLRLKSWIIFHFLYRVYLNLRMPNWIICMTMWKRWRIVFRWQNVVVWSNWMIVLYYLCSHFIRVSFQCKTFRTIIKSLQIVSILLWEQIIYIKYNQMLGGNICDTTCGISSLTFGFSWFRWSLVICILASAFVKLSRVWKATDNIFSCIITSYVLYRNLHYKK